MNDLESSNDRYFYEGNEEITDITWLEQPIQQLFKAMVIMLFRKRIIQGIPRGQYGHWGRDELSINKKSYRICP